MGEKINTVLKNSQGHLRLELLIKVFMMTPNGATFKNSNNPKKSLSSQNFIQIGFWLTFRLVIIKDYKQNTIVIFNILLLNS